MKIIQNTDLDEAALASLSRMEREWVYNALDCCVTLEVCEELLTQLDEVSSKTYEFSKALQGPILEMGIRGIRIDQRRRAEVLVEFKEKIAHVSANLSLIISEGIGLRNFNWRSPAQLKSLMYDVFGFKPIRKRNARGQMAPSVNRDALEKLQQYYLAEPIVLHILALRDMDKKRSWLETEVDSDGRMRTSYNIAGTTTGRLSSSISDFGTGMNAQNIDRSLRSVFIPDPGMKFCNLDLEQGDSRNVGAICWHNFVEEFGEAFAGSYLDACESGDLHTTVSRLIWRDLGWTGDNAADKKVAEKIFYRQDSYRQMAKKGGHGINYYGTPATMAMHLKVPKPLIVDFQHSYFSAFPVIGQANHGLDLPNWHNLVRKNLLNTNTITTLLGRRRRFFGRPSDDETIRAAIAYEPQSLTADEIDTGLLRLFRSNRVQLLAQVHDSILFQFPEELEDEIVPWATNLLKVIIPLAKGREFFVPVEAKTGWNWGDADDKNPQGLRKFKGHDDRKREVIRKVTPILGL